MGNHAKGQASVGECVRTLRAMNAACNPDKFGPIRYVYNQGKQTPRATVIEVEGVRVKAAGGTQYGKFPGGNANVLTTAPKDIKKMRQHARAITAQLCRHVPSQAIIMAIMYGCILAQWLYKRSVRWPTGIGMEHHMRESKEMLGIMCNMTRRVLYVPLKTPKQFFIHEKGMAMTTPLQKFWETNMVDTYKAANARHAWVRESTQRAIT